MKETVAILGASSNKERYAYKAFQLLKSLGHTPIPINPTLKELEGVKVFASLKEIDSPIDTVTLYVSPQISSTLQDELIKLKPARVIFNPGSENPSLQAALVSAGIAVEEACTLVLLKTNQF